MCLFSACYSENLSPNFGNPLTDGGAGYSISLAGADLGYIPARRSRDRTYGCAARQLKRSIHL
jgi:hypothetical protein